MKGVGVWSKITYHGHKEDETGIDYCFEGSKKEPIGRYAAKGNTGWSSNEDNSPSNSSQT